MNEAVDSVVASGQSGDSLMEHSDHRLVSMDPPHSIELDSSSDGDDIYERPVRTPVVKAPKSSASIQLEALKEDWWPASCYQPLADGEFRILKLHPSKRDDNYISYSFVTTSVQQHMKYETISYLWGGPGQTSVKVSLLDPHGKDHPIFIRSHLYDALRNVRHPLKVKHFWIDALCINYGGSDKTEKK